MTIAGEGRLAEHARKMSIALCKVRPLGGSEMFVRVGDESYADAEMCGQLIDGMRNDLHALRVLTKLQERKLSALPKLVEALDPDLLEAIADEIDCFEHSARAGSLRVIARQQRAALASLQSKDTDNV